MSQQGGEGEQGSKAGAAAKAGAQKAAKAAARKLLQGAVKKVLLGFLLKASGVLAIVFLIFILILGGEINGDTEATNAACANPVEEAAVVDKTPEGATTTTTTAGTGTTTAPTTTAAPRAAAPAATDGTYAGIHLNADQVKMADRVMAVAKTMFPSPPDLASKAAVIGIATAMQESSLNNKTSGDRDSVGIFQQRPSQGWGTVAELTNPEIATQKFFNSMKTKVKGWETLPVAEVAQTVQISAFPEKYAKWTGMSTELVKKRFPGVVAANLPEGENAYCDDSMSGAVAPGVGEFRYPLTKFARITSDYGMRTLGGRTRLHAGIDIGAARGAQIVAVAAGKVIYAHCSSGSDANCNHDGNINTPGCGWDVLIIHDNGTPSESDDFATKYCHMVERPSVKAGQMVQAGTILGKVGMSGNVTAVHLHFETHIGLKFSKVGVDTRPDNGGNSTEPIAFMKTRGVDMKTGKTTAK